MSVLFSIIIYLICINALTYAAYAHDKRAARYRYWRVPEKHLFMLLFLGGTPAGLIAAKRLRHKTQKHRFKAMVAVITGVQVVVVSTLLLQLI